MTTLDRIKEYIISEYPKRMIIKMYELRQEFGKDICEKEIYREITSDVDKKFKLTSEEINKISFFIRKYMEISLRVDYEYEN